MKRWLAAAACACAFAASVATAAEPEDSPGRESNVAGCAQVARALNLQGKERERYIAACMAAKEKGQPPADEDPVLAAARRSC